MAQQVSSPAGRLDYVVPLLFPSASTNDTADLFGFVVGEHYRSLMTYGVSRLAELGVVAPAYASQVTKDIQAAPIDLDTAWHPGRGIFEQPLMSRDTTMSPRAIDEFFIHLAFLSAPVSREFQSRDDILYFNHALTGRGAALRGIFRSADSLMVETRSGDVLPLTAAKPDPRITAAAEPLVESPAIEVAGRKIAFQFRENSDPDCTEHIAAPVAARHDEILQGWTDALSLIRSVSVPYFEWCVGSVRHIIPVENPDGAMISGSQGQFPGQVYMSATLEPIKLAEMLIHEASHQYFRAAQLTGQIADPASGEVFYSPVVGRERPVDKLLLAYHAFVNVYAFMIMCERQGLVADGFVPRNMAQVANELRTLARGLDAASSFTPLGRRMWQEMKVAVPLQ